MTTIRMQNAECRMQKRERSVGARTLLHSAFCILHSRAQRALLPRNISHLPWSQAAQELPHFVESELGVAGLDHQEELVARGAVEAPHVEDRVIGHRQSIEGEHAEDRAECGEQNRALER